MRSSGLTDALFERRRCGHELERRAGLVEVLHRAIAAGVLLREVVLIGIERRPAGHREDLAAVRIHHDGGAAIGARRLDAGPQLALDDVLQVLVDRQLERCAGRGRSLEPAEGVAARIGLHQDLALAPAHRLVVGRLDAVQADVVDADVAEQLRGELAVRIEALALFHEADALELEGGDPLGFERRGAPLHVHEGALQAEPLEQLLADTSCRSPRGRRTATRPSSSCRRFRWGPRRWCRRRRCRRAPGRGDRRSRRACRAASGSRCIGDRRARPGRRAATPAARSAASRLRRPRTQARPPPPAGGA